MKNAILFDLDGTLLPMDNDYFIRQYFRLIGKKMALYGYEPQHFTDVIMQGCGAMMQNDGRATNKELFWNVFFKAFGDDAKKDVKAIDSFYENEFASLKVFTNPQPQLSMQAVHAARTVADVTVLATSPVFPETAVRERLRWAGLRYEDFDYVSSYENSYYTKPKPGYFLQIMDRLSLTPENCLMVGNDMDDDICPAVDLGMNALYVTDYSINRSGSIYTCTHVSFAALADCILHFFD